MKNRNFAEFFKNAAGTIFLLAAAFFVCSTFLSMRAVFADPIAPQQIAGNAQQATRAGTTARGATRASPRTTTAAASRTGGATTTANSRTVAGRTTNTASRAQAAGTPTSSASRNVISRGTTAATTSRATANRAVIARTGTTQNTQARVSLSGSAIRGSKSTSSNYTYLSGKLYTGNYANIIDQTTGLISAEAYSNCMESYYTCMDEICTARNAAQRRCACAGRVKAFADAEANLENANEELIKVSGELALLIASKGKDISAAFQLTDAEKVMNCVSWRDASKNGTATETEFGDWCANHAIYDSTCSRTTAPSYCKSNGNNFGFDVSNLDGSGSDILASLKSWADAKDATKTIYTSDENGFLSSLINLTGVVGGLTGTVLDLNADGDVKDSLAETWGYELFEYAHNNVCNRVLDSCFNGIYEACGTPPSGGRKCSNGASSCPYNYNSIISVTNSGSYELNFVNPNTGYSTSNSATCFGYTSTSGDPYSNLRGPVADSRRSILQKYALDANADCDAYGEQLRTTAQNIGYQKVAAQQALQQKRLEFMQEETETILADATAAGTAFNECLSEIYDCYESVSSSNESWPTARVKTYCAQIANVPNCYNTMICNPSTAQFKAVIDVPDDAKCLNSQDYTKNTCRNVVTLSDILKAVSDNPAYSPNEGIGDSAGMREKCLQDSFVEEIRNWDKVN